MSGDVDWAEAYQMCERAANLYESQRDALAKQVERLEQSLDTYKAALKLIAASSDPRPHPRTAAGIARTAIGCEICGGTNDVRDRGWHDEGSTLYTCEECDAP